MLTAYIEALDCQVSRLGLGTVKIGRNQGLKYPTSFDLPNDKDITDLFALAQELGINLLDTAPAYGHSEQRLGDLLKTKLKDWIIMTKAGETFVNGLSHFDFTPQAITNSVHQSLRRLRRDHIDILLIHSDGNDSQIIAQYEIFACLDKLKQAGDIRMGGLSSKTVVGGIASLDHADCVMATYNPTMTNEKVVLDHAEKLNKPAFIKKAFCSGHLKQIDAVNPIQHAIEFILKHSCSSHVITGTINPQHLIENSSFFQ